MKNNISPVNLYIIAFLFVLNCFTVNLNSQIKGKVYDAETNMPVENVNISCNNKIVSTDKNGSFLIESSGWLIFSHLSYNTDSLNVFGKEKELTFFLTPKQLSLNEVLVKGLFHQSRLKKIPASVSLLKKSDLVLISGISYLEKLNQLPGVYVHTGTLNTNRITIRGIGSRTPYGTNRVKAFYNDIPLTSADGTTNIEDIDEALINNIDVYKGPKSAVYGAGLGGIILLSDKKRKQEGLHGNASLISGMFNSYKPVINLYFRKAGFSSNVFYTNFRSDGFRENSNYNRHSAQLKFSFDTKRNNTELLFHYIDLKAHIPSSLNIEDFIKSPDKAATNWLAVKGFEQYKKLISGLNNIFRINDKLSNKTVVYANLSDSYESRPFNILDDKNHRLGLKNYFDFKSDKLQIKLGFELIDEQYNWEIYETNSGIKGELLNSFSEKRNQASFFTDIRMSLNRLIIETGISYNYQNYKLKDLLPELENLSGEYKYKDIFAPFIGVNFELNKTLHFYSSFSYGFSYPTVEETLLPDGQINNNLKPETGNCFELGARLNLFDGHFFMDAGTYYLLVDNLLVTERVTEEIFTGKNAGKTSHSGIELSTTALINKLGNYNLPKVKLSVSGALGENKFKDFVDNEIDYKGNFLPGLPQHILNSAMEFKYAFGLYLNLSHHIIGEQYLNDGNSEKYKTYQLAHSKVGYTWQSSINKKSIDIHLAINNLFDVKYASMILVNAPSFGGNLPRYYYPGMPRYFQFGLSIDF